mgnify:CR=1
MRNRLMIIVIRVENISERKSSTAHGGGLTVIAKSFQSIKTICKGKGSGLLRNSPRSLCNTLPDFQLRQPASARNEDAGKPAAL